MPSTTLWVTAGATEARQTARTSFGRVPGLDQEAADRAAPLVRGAVGVGGEPPVRLQLVAAGRGPAVISVLPMSRVRSMGSKLRERPARSANSTRAGAAPGRPTPSAAGQQRAVVSDSRGDAVRPASEPPAAEPVAAAERARAPIRRAASRRDRARGDRGRISRFEVRRRAACPGRCQPDRAGRRAGRRNGFTTLRPTPTATQAGASPCPAGLAEDAAELAVVQHEIVGPLERDRRPRRRSSSASAIARPARRLSSSTPAAARAGGAALSQSPPRGECQRRPREPRPAVCSAATTAVPDGAPCRGQPMQRGPCVESTRSKR